MQRCAIVMLLSPLASTLLISGPCWAVISGSSLALKSGALSGTSELLSNDGYAGTYINVTSPGDLTVTVNASGTVAAPGDMVHMNMVLADTKAGFDFDPTVAADHSFTFHNIRAGTYFIRNEYTNDLGSASRSLKINSLDVTAPAMNAATFTINNATDSTSLKANALATADSFIANYRRGPATLTLANAVPGTNVHVKLIRHAFNFGCNVPGVDLSPYLGTPTPGSTADNFQSFIASHYMNTFVPSNAGKWSFTEGTQNSPNMSNVNTLLNFVQSHNMRARMHAMIWGDQNPTWVLDTTTNAPVGTGVLAQAVTGNTAPYLSAINNRINYYVGTGTPTDPSTKYIELDVHNEELHRIGPWRVLGAAGEANMFKTVADRVAAAGANTRLYVNEFNVLQNAPASVSIPASGSASYPYSGVSSGLDVYANYYRQNIDDIQNAAIAAGYGPVISGVGSQYYVAPGHSADTVMKALQNLAVTGLPMSLTEFGIGGAVTDQATAATYMEEAMRMVFGNPDATTFMYWGFWAGATDPNLQGGGILVNTTWKNPDGSWNLTPAGKRYEWLFGISPDATQGGTNSSPWTTDVTLPVGADGTVDLTGFYGDYSVTVDGKAVPLSLLKGTSAYSLTVPVGDYNSDGVVNAADYTVWRDTFGSATDLRADGNGDGMIDAGDYDTWLTRFGNDYASGPGAAAAVPEPTTFLMLMAGGALLVRSPYRKAAQRLDNLLDQHVG
jgi:GH35 family endo-1,4-beta-xylanase